MILKLVSVEYTGESIGETIHLEIKVRDKLYSLDRVIKLKQTLKVDDPIIEFEAPAEPSDENISIKVVEDDLIFDDVGETTSTLHIDPNQIEPQEFNFEVRAQEIGTNFRKSTAIFKVKIGAKIFDPNCFKPRPYNSISLKRNYNRFDNEIADAVCFWNDEFSKQDNPPPVPLDPNLVKAMIYVESVMGYGKHKDYPSYPDVMQVADPRNDAIYALKNIYNSNPDRKKMGTEYEFINGQEVSLNYPEANGSSARQSMYWGVRWLYHKAQNEVKLGGYPTGREWFPWKKAVRRYNSRPSYEAEVYRVYNRDTGAGYKLLSFAALFFLIAGVAGNLHFKNVNLQMANVAATENPDFYAYRETLSDQNQLIYAFYIVRKETAEKYLFSIYPYNFPVAFFDPVLTVQKVPMVSRSDEQWLAVRGSAHGDSHVFVALMVYYRNGFEQVYKCDSEDFESGFDAPVVLLDDFDKDGDIEVVESVVFPDPTLPDEYEVTQTLYDLTKPRCLNPVKQAKLKLPYYQVYYDKILPELTRK